MIDELSSFIDAVHREPYSLISNNCLNKSLRIKAKAEELGKGADLVCCIGIIPVKKWHNLSVISPHVYTEIEGEKVDVALDPEREKLYYENNEWKIVISVNISSIRRNLCRGAGSRVNRGE